MTKINLSKRLLAISKMVDKNSVTLDVGCDHALLDIYLSQNKIVKKGIASDVTVGALSQAKKNINLSNVNNIDVRLADGLEALKPDDNIDTIIISGLGNQKIVSILKKDVFKLKNIKNIIIQSNTGYEMVRKEVTRLGYFIEDEVLVKENKIIYVIIKFVKGKKKYNKKQLYFGPVLLKNKNELFIEMVQNEVNKNELIINKLPNRKILKKITLKLIIKALKKEIT